jgi:chemotaxis signal transduction protein
MTFDNTHDQFSSFAGQNSEPTVRALQLFRAGSLLCGIFGDEIATVAKWREPTPLPQAPKSVKGVVSIHGRMLTVLDLAWLLIGDASSSDNTSLESPSREDSPQHLIALRGDEQLAVAVDELGETIEIGDRDFDGTPETAGTLVVGVIHREGLDIQILNPKELFPTAIQGRERRRRRF